MKIRDNYRIVIDGYNLIFQCGLQGKRRDSLALEKARQRAIQTIGKWLGDDRERAAIVFDASRLPIKEDHNVSQIDGLTIIYAVDYDDADSMIEEIIRTHSSPKQLLIVSSDHRLHKAALRRSAQPIDSDVWYDDLEQSFENTDSQEHTGSRSSSRRSGTDADPDFEKEPPAGLSNIDWIKEFGIQDDD